MSKVININTEILLRSAEDDLFYFNRINDAYKKLKKAADLSPDYLKNLILLCDVTFIKGYIKKALALYLKAEKLNNENIKVLASIANCFYVLENYNKALLYCNKVISNQSSKNYAFFSQVFEIKINILMSQKQYKQAYKTWKHAENILNSSLFNEFDNINYKILNEKIKLQKKLHETGLKIV